MDICGPQNMKIILITILTLILACQGADNSKGFEIYCIDEIVPIESNIILDDFIIPDTPFISMDHIISYDWNNHEILLTNEAWVKIGKFIEENYTISKQPFIATLNGKPIYFCRIWSHYNAERPDSPIIDLFSLMEGKFLIGGYGQFDDKINNSELYNFLKSHNKIQEL